MKKKGATKTAGSGKTSGTTNTGDKRQLPLDFSRHALQSKRVAPNGMDEGAAKTAQSPQLREAESSFPTVASTSDPPVIHVDLLTFKTYTSIQSANGATRHTTENEISTTTGERLLEEDHDSIYRELSGGDEDDALLTSRIRRESEDRDTDHEDDSIMPVKTEGGHDLVGSSLIKDGHVGNDDRNLDVILPPKFRWKTVYVAAFELALDTVLPDETSLFTDEELLLFQTYRELPDDPKHLFVRLFLRNQKYWQRQSKLDGRYREIEDLVSAIQQLSAAGLLMDQGLMQDPGEAVALLTVDELKILARKVGILEKMSGKQRNTMIAMIMEHFRQQSFISKRLLVTPNGVPRGEHDRMTGLTTHIFSGDGEKRDKALISKIIDISGPCIKIYPTIMKVFERLHLVFHRSREHSDRPVLLEAILAKIGRRTFPTYEITRTNTVFKDRDELLKYEAAIKLHYDLSAMIESAMGPGRSAVVYVRDSGRATDNNGTNTLPRRSNSVRSMTKLESDKRAQDDEAEQERRRLEVIDIYEKVIKEAEDIRDTWRHYVATETELCNRNPNYFLLRFTPGWVYTQVLRLELRAFAFLKRFEEESLLLHELLDQQVYSLGQRGEWYERLALVKSNYAYNKRLGKQEALQVLDATLIQARIVRLESELKVPFRDRHDFSYMALRKAQRRVLTGERLNTPGTAAPSYASSHAYSYIPNSMGSSHPTMQQRPLWRNIDGSDCSVEELALSYYKTLGYNGHHSENSILSTLFGLLFWDILFSPQPGVFETSYQTEPLDLRTDAFFLQRQDKIMERIENIAKSKIIPDPELSTSRTVGSDDIGKGVKPGAERSEQEQVDDDEEEETLQQRSRRPMQTSTRTDRDQMSSVSSTEQDLESSKPSQEQTTEQAYDEFITKKRKDCFYLDLLQTHDDLYRERNVFCVGVNWTYSKEDLLQIAECIGGDAISEICKILAQEYNKRCSGMPDLCCWNYEKKLVKFVEVKGPGDRLSSKQQVWIDLMSSLGMDVELCIVQVSKDEDKFLEERESMN
ncbi:hypothetical protein B0O80DRAFT_495898 [Mortierella sp. GBAus27b]|nr:hypothetical protein B0O80DRAFT_495898 [Mortierella sp. GBAus27b]